METSHEQASGVPSHRSGPHFHSRGSSYHWRSLWRHRSWARHGRSASHESESVSSYGAHAELLGLLSRTRPRSYDFAYLRIDPLLAIGFVSKDRCAALA